MFHPEPPHPATARTGAMRPVSVRNAPTRRHRRLPTLFASALLLSGCTWVELTDAGLAVTVVDAAPDNCAVVGRISTNTQAEVAGIARNADRIADELEWLARNEAADLGANTLLPTSEISGGRRNFDALNCPR
ncbi:MAG TPA: DUF4156 domain-containing protein [Pseudomonadales bacterium]|nr:DUF4156 domain-containing protein [Pseudomonadales bacterium]